MVDTPPPAVGASIPAMPLNSPVVLLHGQPGSGEDWSTVIEALSGRAQVLAVDRPGYAASRLPPGGFHDGALAALASMDAAGIDSAVVCGHSYGGGVALALALLAPTRVSALVLAASVGPGCVNGWDRLLAWPVTGEISAVAGWCLSPWFARAWVRMLARRRRAPIGHHEWINWALWGSAHHAHGAMWRTFLTEQRALFKELDTVLADLGRISAATLVLADPRDTMVPLASAQALARGIPGARLQLVPPGTGHHLPRRAPLLVASAILSAAAGAAVPSGS